MRGVKAKRLRRENPEAKPKQINKPKLFMVHGEETYIPRKQRRALMRYFMTGLRKGRIDLNQLNAERTKRSHDRNKQG